MTAGRTADARVFVDDGTAMAELNSLLGLTIAGDVTVTTEAYLGSVAEQASVHAAGGGVSFSTIVDTSGFDGDGFRAGQFALLCPTAPRSWHHIPVGAPPAGVNAPQSDALTRPWELARRGRGSYGTTIVPFSNFSQASASNIGPSANIAANSRVLVVIEAVTGDPTNITFSGPAGVGRIPQTRDTAPVMAIWTATGTGRLQAQISGGSSASMSGWVCVGSFEELPDG